MKKIKKQKLELSKTTIRQLSPSELPGAQGAIQVPTGTCPTRTCFTCDISHCQHSVCDSCYHTDCCLMIP